MKKIFSICFVLFASSQLFAQQDPMFSQYMFNSLVLNPAYAGSREVISTTALYRNQWVNIDGAPKTVTFSAHAPLPNDKVGLGFTFCNDRLGVTNTNNLGLSYAYRIRFRNKAVLSMGLQASIMQYQADFASVRHSFPPNVNDPSFSMVVNRWLPNFGVGLWYYTNKFYAGLSMPNILTNQLNEDQQVFRTSQRARQSRHLFLTAGYVFGLSPTLKLKPSALLKYVPNAPIEFDINANLWFYDIFAVGVSYRTRDSFIGMVEIQATPQLGIGYAYDYTLTPLTRYTSGSHEIMVRYEFGFSRTRIITPRYF